MVRKEGGRRLEERKFEIVGVVWMVININVGAEVCGMQYGRIL